MNTLLAAHRPAVVSLVSAIVLLLGCDGDGATGEVARDAAPEAAAPDTQSPSRDVAPDVLVEDAPATTSDGGEAPDAGADAAAGDAGSDAALTPALEVPAFSAYVTPPAGSLVPPELASCALYKDEVCRDDTRHVCALYDAGAGDWATGVPPMTEQAFVFDRYYDLYHQAAGQSMDFRFTRPILAGTPEAEWSQPDAFRRYSGYGDASGWTGTALWGAAARYAVTGTAADYDRMLEKLESMALLYQVTGVPGLLARSHWAMLPEGAPEPHGHWRRSIQEWERGDGSDGHFSFPIDESLWPQLPEYYHTEVVIDGAAYPTTPRAQSDASRDMYVRSLPGVMLAWDLLGEGEREDRVRAVLRTEIPCTLARMRKGRIVNLQQNAQILEAVTAYFSGTGLYIEEGDLDFATIDTMVFYILEQPHPLHPEAFDPTCPDGPPMEVSPDLELDAANPQFLLQLLALFSRETGVGKVPIAFSQHVTVRATDTLFITQWALTAHYLTGDERYRDFVAALIDEIPYAAALNTLGAFQLPKYCAPHFAPSLVYPSLYHVLARVDRERYPRYWRMLSHVARSEGREKEFGRREDPFWGILYNRMADDSTDPDDPAAYVRHFVDLLATYGMNPDDKLEPDRNYPRNFVDHEDPEVPLESIAEGDPEWAICEEPVNVMGLELPAARIDGVPIRAVDPLPLPKRIGGTMLWQMDPWMVKREYGGTGMDEQWPMLGMFTPYWVGRSDGVIAEGQGLALAWRDTGEVCR